MERVLSSILEEIECYINDIAAFSDDWESHKNTAQQANDQASKLSMKNINPQRRSRDGFFPYGTETHH
jgi:hypothetical protein